MRQIFGKIIYETLAEVLAPKHTALIVVDMQNDFLSVGGNSDVNEGRDLTSVPPVIHSLVALVASARAAGVMVVHLQNTTLANGLSDSPSFLAAKARTHKNFAYTLEGTWGQGFVPELEPAPGDAVVKKHRSSGFVNTDLELILRANRVESVVVAGCITNGCVLATAQHARFNDYYAIVPQDCVWTWADDDTANAALRMMDTSSSADIMQVWATAGEPQ